MLVSDVALGVSKPHPSSPCLSQGLQGEIVFVQCRCRVSGGAGAKQGRTVPFPSILFRAPSSFHRYAWALDRSGGRQNKGSWVYTPPLTGRSIRGNPGVCVGALDMRDVCEWVVYMLGWRC